METPIVLVTGAAGLIGSATVKKFLSNYYKVIGIDNNSRKEYFGDGASTLKNIDPFIKNKEFTFIHADICDFNMIRSIFSENNKKIQTVIHTAAQPAHMYAVKHPLQDFDINARATLNILESMRDFGNYNSLFIFCSSSKVYGDNVNQLPLQKYETRLDLPKTHRFYKGITESFSVDQCNHSMYGAGKLAADIYVQEFSQLFNIKSFICRPGCLSGPGHMGVRSHGFLAYLTRCAATGYPYEILGYEGLQVRDQIHAEDVAEAFYLVNQRPPKECLVTNFGGGRKNNCSIIEAIEIAQKYTGKKMKINFNPNPRTGDHKWYIGSQKRFMDHYPEFKLKYNVEDIIHQMCDFWKAQ